MKLGKVIGVVWATKKVPQIHGCRLYVVQPILENGQESGQPLVVADPKNIAAPGDRIVFVTNTDAAQAFDTGFAPVNASVVELVDDIA